MEPRFPGDGITRPPRGTTHLQLQQHNNSLRHYRINCGSNQSNITTLSSPEVGECDLPRSQVHVERTYIQLLQLTGFLNTKVKQYNIENGRTISHCDMHSHSSIVANGHSEYIHDVTRDQCNQMHTIGTFLVTSSLDISNLKVNETSFHSVTLAGSVTPNVDCTGTQFLTHTEHGIML